MSDMKHIVSMLAAEEKITLFTVMGEVLELQADGPHDTSKIAEVLTPKLNGGNVVELDLNDYLNIQAAIVPEGYESEGMIVTQIIDGKEVQGIFFPSSVAVQVQYEGEEVTIPKVEKLQKHAQRANAEKSPAVRNFLRRMAPVAKNRLHSAEDLMDFIERSDLPLTQDGMIIGYKKVNKNEDGKFVDVHSGKVAQQVGSRVWMDVEMVDPSRTNSCSNGLHVANLGYLSGFGGSHTLIVLVDPANFIAVPHGETNKARVASYDVIGVMTANAHNMVNSGTFVTGDQTFKSVISDAVAGRHLRPFEKIKVGDRCVLEVLPMEGAEEVFANLESAVEVKSSGESLNSDAAPEKANKKDIVKMAKTAKGSKPWDNITPEAEAAFKVMMLGGSKADAARAGNTSTRSIGRWMDKFDYDEWQKAQESKLTVAERARQLFQAGKLEALAAFKSAKKKSYAALGFKQSEIKQIEQATA
jgi:hypothetical protein